MPWFGRIQICLPSTRVEGVGRGQPAYVREFLENKSREQKVLFERIPWVNDPQAVWLLLMNVRLPGLISGCALFGQS